MILGDLGLNYLLVSGSRRRQLRKFRELVANLRRAQLPGPNRELINPAWTGPAKGASVTCSVADDQPRRLAGDGISRIGGGSRDQGSSCGPEVPNSLIWRARFIIRKREIIPRA